VTSEEPRASGHVTLFLAGDVMTGRGIDQIMPQRSAPVLHERWVQDANDYVLLAERRNGPVPRRVTPHYVWGDALEALAEERPDLRIINLETSITTSDRYQPAKGIHYRMHPGNVAVLAAAGIDCCVLANNHVLDWGTEGLLETLDVLDRAGLARAGAGRDAAEAARPAALPVGLRARVLVFAFGLPSSGVPPTWAATARSPGIGYLADTAARQVDRIAARVDQYRRPGDLVLASLHWGGNWGYHVPEEHVSLAHRLVDDAGVDVVHGHSSHHPLAVEVYHDRPILYGCGDFLNDYEGISGYEAFRTELTLMYFPVLDPVTGMLVSFTATPMELRRFRLHRCGPEDVGWLAQRLDQQSRALGVRVDERRGRLHLRWQRNAQRRS
jgi:poly-gamma-glutamate synthesis protein (capsule biosynthesis protein)